MDNQPFVQSYMFRTNIVYLAGVQCCPACGMPGVTLRYMLDGHLIEVPSDRFPHMDERLLQGWKCDNCGVEYERVDVVFERSEV